MPEKPTFQESYDLREQDQRFKAQDTELRIKALRVEKRPEIVGWWAAASVAITLIAAITYYNLGPDENLEQQNQVRIEQINANKELKLACINQGGLWVNEACTWSKGEDPNG